MAEVGPSPIRKLEESLVNRIAAGEIIHRPSSALKELLENALDAGSTQIKIVVKDGGLKLLQISDNGCGIRKTDLPILCERFTTSKLSSFSDLQSLTTYGFRGEALASISHVAHLTVTTKTKNDTTAWRAHYSDGVLVPAKPGATEDPKPCAGNEGTTLTVEDLFYNTPTRLAALRNPSEEYSRIVDVVTRYAVHNSKVSLTCKKVGTSAPEVNTQHSSNTKAAIKTLYGAAIASELLHVTASSEGRAKKAKLKGKSKQHDDDPQWEAEAYATSPNYQGKKTTLLLFINNRLVESTKIKRALEAVYAPILPKGSSPFIYLSLQIDPNQVDVNVHPTKREVHFMNEDKIIDDISDAVQLEVAQHGQSRTFEYQTLLTGGVASVGVSNIRRDSSGKRKVREDEGEEEDVDMEDAEQRTPATTTPNITTKPKKPLPQHMIRTSGTDRTLDSMIISKLGPKDGKVSTTDDAIAIRYEEEIEESRNNLRSVHSLRAAVLSRKHSGLTEILKGHAFVGVVDMALGLSLIQHNVQLYLVNHGHLAEEFLYQIVLRRFGSFDRFKLQPAPRIRDLIELAVDAEGDKVLESGMRPEKVTDAIVNLLVSSREMLQEYFSISITEDGVLESLPILLSDYMPNLDRLPLFLMRLGPEVDWTDEESCLHSIAKEIALLNSPGTLGLGFGSSLVSEEEEKAARWQLQHVLFPAMRKYFVPPKGLLETSVFQVADLPDLYRIFERC